MGYQESLVYIKPQEMLDPMVRKCEQALKAGFYQLKILPAEQLFEGDGDPKLAGISLGAYHVPSENQCLRRESFQQYAQRLQSRAEQER